MIDCDQAKVSFPSHEQLPKVLLADSYTMGRVGMRTVLESRRAAEVVGEVETPTGLFTALERIPCDVVILDIAMTDLHSMDGAALVRYLARSFPAVQTLIIATIRSPGLLNAVLRHGATSLIERNADITELLQALRLSFRGRSYLGKGVERVLAEADLHPRRGPRLTTAELEVLRLFAYEGLTSRQISDLLHRSRKTISRHKRSLQSKLGLLTDQELINYCHFNSLDTLISGNPKKEHVNSAIDSLALP